MALPVQRSLLLRGVLGSSFLQPVHIRGSKTLSTESTVSIESKVNNGEKFRDFSEMPGPVSLPVLGSLWEYIKPGGLKFSKMFEVYKARSEQFGSVYREQLGGLVSVVVSDPVEYQKVIHSEPKQPQRVELGPMAHFRRKRKLGLGLVNSQGDEWYKQRTVLSKKMLRPLEVVPYCEAMSDVADDFVAHLRSILDDKGQVDDLKTEIFKWALESVGVFLFDDRVGCYRVQGPPQRALDFISNLQGFFAELQEMLYTLPLYKIVPTPSYRRFEKNFSKILEIGQYYVDKRAALLEKTPDEDRDGFVWYLLGQKQLSTKEANLSAIEMMTGGVETVSNSLLWALLLLARNPDVQQNVVDEIQNTIGGKMELTRNDLAHLPYLKAFFKETFRHYPITFATSRILQSDMEIGGYIVPKGVQVQASLYGMGHDEALFPDAESVKPERWLRAEDNTRYQALANLVWGHGPRMCIGRRLAEQELYIVIIKILQNFHLSWRVEYEVPQPVLHTVMTPDRPLKVCFSPRH